MGVLLVVVVVAPPRSSGQPAPCGTPRCRPPRLQRRPLPAARPRQQTQTEPGGREAERKGNAGQEKPDRETRGGEGGSAGTADRKGAGGEGSGSGFSGLEKGLGKKRGWFSPRNKQLGATSNLSGGRRSPKVVRGAQSPALPGATPPSRRGRTAGGRHGAVRGEVVVWRFGRDPVFTYRVVLLKRNNTTKKKNILKSYSTLSLQASKNRVNPDLKYSYVF